MADPYANLGHAPSGLLVLTFSSVGAQLVAGSNNHFTVNLGRTLDLGGSVDDWEVTLVSLRYGVDAAFAVPTDVFVYSSLQAPTALFNGTEVNLTRSLLNQSGAGPFSFESDAGSILWFRLNNTKFNSVEIEIRTGAGALPSTGGVSTLATFAARHIRRS